VIKANKKARVVIQIECENEEFPLGIYIFYTQGCHLENSNRFAMVKQCKAFLPTLNVIHCKLKKNMKYIVVFCTLNPRQVFHNFKILLIFEQISKFRIKLFSEAELMFEEVTPREFKFHRVIKGS